MRTQTILFSFLSLWISAEAQRISYSEIDKDDYRQMNFEIIGKVGGNIHVYKNFKSRNEITVFDNSMQVKEKVRLEMLPERVNNVDFVAFPEHYYMFYQFQKRNLVTYAAMKLDANGKMLSDPIILDTSHVDGGSEIKVYSMVYSENRQRILVYKINRRSERFFTLTTLLYDRDLSLVRKSAASTQLPTKEGVFGEFTLDNDGDLAFGRSTQSSSREFVTHYHLMVKRAEADTLQVSEITGRDYTIDEIRLRPDNYNKRFLLTSFYHAQRRGNIDGLLSYIWDKKTGRQLASYRFPFNDTLRQDARSDNSSLKLAFNDYFIRQLLPTRDGGYAVVAELYYTSSRGNAWNRWDYIYGPGYGFNPYSYYPMLSPYNQWRWADPWNRWGGNNMVRHVSENIMIFYFSPQGRLEWSNTVRKRQFDDNSDILLSYLLFNTGGEIRFLFNQLERREQILNSVTINPEGRLKRDPTLKGLDRNYEFMPKYGKQIGLREIVMPCMNRNYICFAKLDF